MSEKSVSPSVLLYPHKGGEEGGQNESLSEPVLQAGRFDSVYLSTGAKYDVSTNVFPPS